VRAREGHRPPGRRRRQRRPPLPLRRAALRAAGRSARPVPHRRGGTVTETTDLRRLMQGVIPYLTVDGAEGAVAFYGRAFGAVQHGESVKDEQGRVMHVTLEVNGGAVMLNDLFPEYGGKKADGAPGPIVLQLVTLDGQAWWDRALAAGCEIDVPFELAPW